MIRCMVAVRGKPPIERVREEADRLARAQGFTGLDAVPVAARPALLKQAEAAAAPQAPLPTWSPAALRGLQSRDQTTTPAIAARLDTMTLGKRARATAQASHEAAEALKIVAVLEPGASSTLRPKVVAARDAVEAYARGAPSDPRDAVDAVAQLVGPSSPSHEREIVAHLEEAVVAAARGRGLDDPLHAAIAAAFTR